LKIFEVKNFLKQLTKIGANANWLCLLWKSSSISPTSNEWWTN